MFYRAIIIVGLLASPAAAQSWKAQTFTDPDSHVVYVFPAIPSEEEKRVALMEAYRRNGNSMVRMGSIDISEPLTIRPIPIAPPEKADRQALTMPEAVPTPEARPVPVADICTRHGKRRVATHGGRSWRCK